jgi:hypothetical protein
MRWRERQQWRGVGIGKQCAGARGDYREEWVLSSNALVQDVTIESIGKQCAGARGDNGGERVLASNALAQNATRCMTYQVISVTLQE